MPAEPEFVSNTGETYYLLGSAAGGATDASESSNWLDASRADLHAYQVINPGAETIEIWASLDGINWSLIDTTTATSKFGRLEGYFRWIKAVRGAGVTEVTVIWASKTFHR